MTPTPTLLAELLLAELLLLLAEAQAIEPADEVRGNGAVDAEDMTADADETRGSGDTD